MKRNPNPDTDSRPLILTRLSEELHTAGAVDQAKMLAMAVITMETYQQATADPTPVRQPSKKPGSA